MLEIFFNKYKALKTEKYFKNPLFHTSKKYACIGVGNHSLNNIFPLLHHFGVSIKYVCTRHSNWSHQMSKLFPGSISINDVSRILNDPEIAGVFVSASPVAHYELLKALLLAGKKVFVEKPPCSTLAELNELAGISKNVVCKIGLQRRYWPGNASTLNEIKKASSYVYQFYFGPYLSGNVYNELFIHAIDYSIFLFGEFSILSSTRNENNQGKITQLHVRHISGVTGMLELSSSHSWNDPVENLTVHCPHQLLSVQYPLSVRATLKPARVLRIPTESLIKQQTVIKNYFNAGNFIMPSVVSNVLVLQGFYGEISEFIEIVEEERLGAEANDLPGLRPLYKVLDLLNAQ
jgi:virulence factor